MLKILLFFLQKHRSLLGFLWWFFIVFLGFEGGRSFFGARKSIVLLLFLKKPHIRLFLGFLKCLLGLLKKYVLGRIPNGIFTWYTSSAEKFKAIERESPSDACSRTSVTCKAFLDPGTRRFVWLTKAHPFWKPS